MSGWDVAPIMMPICLARSALSSSMITGPPRARPALRTDAETSSAIAVERLGPPRLAPFAGGRRVRAPPDHGAAVAGNIPAWGAAAGSGPVARRLARSCPPPCALTTSHDYGPRSLAAHIPGPT